MTPSATDDTRTRPPARDRVPLEGVSTAPLLPGTLLAGRYRIVALLGRGGMGEVYRADDLTLRQTVALKFLPAGLAGDPGRLARFHEEVRLARQVSHPNVCRVHDLGQSERGPFLSMEYIDGEDLASALRRVGRLTEEKALEVARQVASGLAAAHAAGVVHRDLKAANVMLDAAGRARITDFGLATLARAAGDAAGTPAYMAPEQIAGEPAGPRADVWSFGVLLHEILTGVRPWTATSICDLAQQQREPPPPPSSRVSGLGPDVDALVARCLCRDPLRRPADALEVLAALFGGDRLRAAVDAGQTPSPEAVASAGPAGALRPAIAWACFAVGLLSLIAHVQLGRRVSVVEHAALDRSPEVLAARAQDIAAELGLGSSGTFRTYGFTYDDDVLRFLSRDARPPGEPSPIVFWCRQGPAQPSGRGFLNAMGAHTPPLGPGEVSVVLDPSGRLLELLAVPEPGRVPAPAGTRGSSAADDHTWAVLFRLAGIEAAKAVKATPARLPMTYAETTAAWTAPRGADAGFRVEGALFGGRAVSFEVRGPWDRDPASAPPQLVSTLPTRTTGAAGIVQAVTLGLVLLAALLAWRNVRASRGDQRGALRVALAAFLLALANWAGCARHAPELEPELDLLEAGIARALYQAGCVAILYLALEPHVRRRWPESLVSWSRLLAGRVRDPMVGRDVLVAFSTMSAAALVSTAIIVTATPAGVLLEVHRALAPLLGVRQVVGMTAAAALNAILVGMLLLLLLLLSHAGGRRRLGALAFGAAVVALLFGFWQVIATSSIGAVPVVLNAGLFIVLLTRLGLLAAVVAVFGLVFGGAYLPDVGVLSGWPSVVSWTFLGVDTALATYGLWVSVGREPLFGWASLEGR
jgi:hypothetical protein